MSTRKNGAKPAPVTPAEEETPTPTTPAEIFVAGLSAVVEEFQTGLTEKESVQALFVTPGGEPIIVSGIGALSPDAVVFEGFDSEGARAVAIVPTAQAHLTLKAVPVEEHDEEPRRVGFLTSRDRPSLTYPVPEI